jgi:hypothetical protein
MICEDDIVFLGTRKEIDDVVREFAENESLDVLQLDYNPYRPPIPVSEQLAITNSSALTGCYVVKPRAVAALTKNFAASVDSFSGRGAGVPVDLMWQRLQQRTLVFAVPRNNLVTQRSGHSDIVGRFVKQ